MRPFNLQTWHDIWCGVARVLTIFRQILIIAQTSLTLYNIVKRPPISCPSIPLCSWILLFIVVPTLRYLRLVMLHVKVLHFLSDFLLRPFSAIQNWPFHLPILKQVINLQSQLLRLNFIIISRFYIHSWGLWVDSGHCCKLIAHEPFLLIIICEVLRYAAASKLPVSLLEPLVKISLLLPPSFLIHLSLAKYALKFKIYNFSSKFINHYCI